MKTDVGGTLSPAWQAPSNKIQLWNKVWVIWTSYCQITVNFLEKRDNFGIKIDWKQMRIFKIWSQNILR